jgi:GR25 family glycosyltransferase involved in LPS biosynthesis/tetratricopeptide (TPR) repeat protein
VIPVYCVSLPSSVDRRMKMVDQFARLRLRFEFVDAVDKKLIEADTEVHRGERACLLSHLKTIKKFVEDGHESAVICEDDALFRNNFAPASEAFPMLLLCPYVASFEGSDRIRDSLFTMTSNIWGACAYQITRDYAQKVLAAYDRPMSEYEGPYLSELITTLCERLTGEVCAFVSPPLVIESCGPSLIDHSHQERHRKYFSNFRSEDYGSVDKKTKTVCLCMIVKNEAHVIARCLKSVKDLVSYWIIVDTGSTDGTQEVIRKEMEGVPGELHESAWKDFAANRNEALDLCPKGYVLIIDADDELEIRGELPELTSDAYDVPVMYGNLEFTRPHLFRSDRGFRYKGVLHEYLDASNRVPLDAIAVHVRGGGARNTDPEKYKKDALLLEKALETEPNNERYVFYAAQCWRDAGNQEKASQLYERRTQMVGWVEETYFAFLELARCLERRGRESSTVVDAYLKAYEYRPSRAEALYDLARYLRCRDRHALAAVYANFAASIPRPDDRLFLDAPVYDWRAKDELAMSFFYLGRHREAIALNEEILEKAPEGERERLRANMRFSVEAVAS